MTKLKENICCMCTCGTEKNVNEILLKSPLIFVVVFISNVFQMLTGFPFALVHILCCGGGRCEVQRRTSIMTQ